MVCGRAHNENVATPLTLVVHWHSPPAVHAVHQASSDTAARAGDEKEEYVVPGDRVGLTHEYRSGPGTFVRGSHVLASLVGTRVVTPPGAGGGGGDSGGGSGGASASAGTGLPVVSVQQFRPLAASCIPAVGVVVTGRVTAINARVANVEIVCVGGTPVKQSFSGLIRKENVLASETDRIGMEQCCRPGDVVVAEVRLVFGSNPLPVSMS
jgi:exosome complex RNA-binding protein Csl4